MSVRNNNPASAERGQTHVFCSHSSADKPFVRILLDDIKALGVRVWIDEMELGIGDSLVERLADALATSDYVLACISKTSIESNWVKTELAIAATRGIRENRIFVLPILIGGADWSEIPHFLSHLIYIDFRDPAGYDESLQRLVRRICPDALKRRENSFSTILQDQVLTIDDARVERLLAASRAKGLRDFVTKYLIETTSRPDPTERHWVYLALGKLGGAEAMQALRNGLSDSDSFARLGASRALARTQLTAGGGTDVNVL